MSGDFWEDIWKTTHAGTPTQVTANTNGTFDTQPVLSPDGSKVAFVRDGPVGTNRLRVVNLDGTGDTSLDATNGCEAPLWSPDGQWILYRRVGVIRKIRPDGTGGVTLHTAANVVWPTWDTSGAFIFFQRDPADPTVDSLWVMADDGTGATQIDTIGLGGSGGRGMSAAPPDLIVYTSAPAGTLAKIKTDGTGKTTITTGAAPALFLSRHALAPDTLEVFATKASGLAWPMFHVPLSGTGEVATAPALDALNAVGRGQAYVYQGRVWTVRDSDSTLVSILPDGSDLTVEDTPQNGPTVFEAITMGVRDG